VPTQPPFTISAKVIHLVSRISESLGRINQDYLQSSPQLRKQNRIKTIAGTLAIEGNTLSIDTESDQVTDQASDQVKSLLKILDNQYLAVPEMMERLSLSHRTYFRKNYLNPAVKLGLIEMSHPDKPRSPKQKYRKQKWYFISTQHEA